MTEGSNTFTPMAGTFNFNGAPSLTLTDAQNFSQVTFNSGAFNLAFVFKGDPTFNSAPTLNSDPTFQYSYVLQTNLAPGDWLLFQDAETSPVPEPSPRLLLLVGTALAVMTELVRRWRHRPIDDR
ncbi:MAG: hypothetical protein ACLQOO_21110 [Terriglobia bacterium]